jgi:glycosyltransferase involved in cell wall biosynthesis
MHTNNNNPTVSIIIPVYNEEKYIKQCIESLMKQKIKADEIIIVNNNCTDNTVTLAKQYPVRIENENNQGMIFARNCGFNKAKYDIIARTDADTMLPDNWIEEIKIQFSKPEISALTGGFIFYDFFSDSKIFYNSYQKYMNHFLKNHNIFIGSNMILRKSLWEKVKEFTCSDDKEVHEDIDLSIHLALLGESIVVDPNLTVKMSSRRIKHNPISFFVEYFFRAIKTVKRHKL